MNSDPSVFRLSSDSEPITHKSAYVALAISLISISPASVIIGLTLQEGVSPLIIVFWRLTLATAIMFVSSVLFKAFSDFKQLYELPSREKILLLISGFFLAMHFVTWTFSLSFTSITASVVLVDSSPIFVLILSAVFLNERVLKKQIGGILLSFIGAIIIGFAHFSSTQPTENILGDILALLGALSIAFYLVIGRGVRKDIGVHGYTVVVYGTCALFTLVFILTLGLFGSPFPLLGYSMFVYSLFFLLALIPSCLGHSMYNYSLKYIKAAIISVSFLAEPIGATILAVLLWGLYDPRAIGDNPVSLFLVGFGSFWILLGITICLLGENRTVNL
ncbi:MAG: DMT family transporter [Candidatus Hodarchaeota archaeon]